MAQADAILQQAQESAQSEAAEPIAELRGYLLNNAHGLRDYRLITGYDGLRGLGAIEGNVDKLIANRMKKRGMSWTRLKEAPTGWPGSSISGNPPEAGQLHLWVNHEADNPGLRAHRYQYQLYPRHALPEKELEAGWKRFCPPLTRATGQSSLHSGPPLHSPPNQRYTMNDHQDSTD